MPAGGRWPGLASDSLDAVASLVSMPAIGKRDAGSAVALSLAFVGGDILALRQEAAALPGT